MSNFYAPLELNVPSRDLCKQIPAGAFANSALVWWGACVYSRRHIDGARFGEPYRRPGALPAPTLVEILKEGGARMEFEIANLLLMGGEHADTITDSALEAWLDIQKEKQEQTNDAGRNPSD